MSSAPANDLTPSTEAIQALEAIHKLSARDRVWIYEQIESTQTVQVDELSPLWRAEIAGRLQALQTGTAALHDLDDVEQEALGLLRR